MVDPASGIGIPVAFFAGLVSFLSPCVLPLVPGYLSVVSGVRPSELETAKPRRVIVPSLLFIASFSAIFMALGYIGSRALGSALRGETAIKVSGGLVILMGLLFLLAPFVPRLSREWHVDALMSRAGRGGPIITGAAFAVAWTPCTGPTLGAITSAAGLSDSAAHGVALLAVYCLGLGLPFLITGLAFGAATTAFGFVKRHYPVVIAVGGIVLIAMGILIWTGEFQRLNAVISNWLQDLGLGGLDLSNDT
jgi:cytochrome c-type biogenesis protein